MPSAHLSDYEKERVLYVLDGGALLHKSPWPKLSKYGELYEMYVKYVLRHYDPQRTSIVLDGYGGPSTKDECHPRLYTEAGASVEMTSDDQTQKMPKELFLANTTIKSNFFGRAWKMAG